MNGLGAREVCFHCTLSPSSSTVWSSIQVLTLNSVAIDPPYPVHSGLFHKEAIMLLRRFYIQENEKGMCLQVPSRTVPASCSG